MFLESHEGKREFVNEILLAALPFLGLISMKKDSELPWALRVARWAAVLFGVVYGGLVLCEKCMEVF